MLVYTVKRGETLWQIAKEYQISLDALVAANPHISDPNYILPGSRINVPRLANIPEPEPTLKEWGQEAAWPDRAEQERAAMMQREEALRQESVMRQEETLRQEENLRQDEALREDEALRQEAMMRRQEMLRQEELIREDELLREGEMRRREEMIREEMMREETMREEMMRQQEMAQPQIPEPARMEEAGCAIDGARPCIYITGGGETLHSISEEWGVPLAQLHYHNYRFAQGAQLPSGERIIIPLAHDYRIQVESRTPARGMRGRRRR